jgi:hypothetical protein
MQILFWQSMNLKWCCPYQPYDQKLNSGYKSVSTPSLQNINFAPLVWRESESCEANSERKIAYKLEGCNNLGSYILLWILQSIQQWPKKMFKWYHANEFAKNI